MADIRDWEKYKRGRWQWTSGGYERYLERGCALGDIDAHIESSGQHLVIEAKHWTEDDVAIKSEKPVAIPTGQLIALRELAKKDSVTVWILYGDAPSNNPLYVIRLAGGSFAPRLMRLVLLPRHDRTDCLAYMIGAWQAKSDGRDLVNNNWENWQSLGAMETETA